MTSLVITNIVAHYATVKPKDYDLCYSFCHPMVQVKKSALIGRWREWIGSLVLVS